MVHVMNGVNFKDLAVDLRNQLDAQRLRADTAERGLANCKLALHAQTHNYGVTNLRLIAAEQRNAELSALLQRVIDSSALSFEADAPEELESLEVDICAALSTASPATINQQGEEAGRAKRQAEFVRINSADHCRECGHPDCNGQCFGDDMMGD